MGEIFERRAEMFVSVMTLSLEPPDVSNILVSLWLQDVSNMAVMLHHVSNVAVPLRSQKC